MKKLLNFLMVIGCAILVYGMCITGNTAALQGIGDAGSERFTDKGIGDAGVEKDLTHIDEGNYRIKSNSFHGDGGGSKYSIKGIGDTGAGRLFGVDTGNSIADGTEMLNPTGRSKNGVEIPNPTGHDQYGTESPNPIG